MANIFYKILGKSNILKVLDYLLLDTSIDVSILDICDGISLSRKTVENIINNFQKENIIIETRKVGKTKLLKINKESLISQKLIEINDIILKQQEEKVEIGKKAFDPETMFCPDCNIKMNKGKIDFEGQRVDGFICPKCKKPYLSLAQAKKIDKILKKTKGE